MNFPRYYAVSGINWEFLYEVVYEDDCILILKDLGRFHRFDEDRMFKKPIEKYIDIYGEGINQIAHIYGARKLVEIKTN